MVVKVLFRESFKASISGLAASATRLLSVSLFRAKSQKVFGEQKGESDGCLVAKLLNIPAMVIDFSAASAQRTDSTKVARVAGVK